MLDFIRKDVLIKILVSLGIIILDILLQKITQKAIDRFVKKNKMSQTRNLTIHKIKSVFFHLVAILGMIILWGVSFQNAWVSIAGFIGLIAIGFFAVWSILSNIFAGIILFFYRPFKIEDEIEIASEGIRGNVKDINAFFVILSDKEGSLTHIPNNMIYQKVVKTFSN
jgi:MscS family membrane protein